MNVSLSRGRIFDALTHWVWVPAPLFLLAILVLAAADWREAYVAPPRLLFSFQFTFMTLVSVAVVFLAARTFLVDGTRGLLLLACGALAWGLSGVVAGAVSRGDVNTSVTIHNLCVWLAAVWHLMGVALPARTNVPPVRRAWALVGGGSATLGVIALIAIAGANGWTPPFFLQGQGGTPVRQAVLGSAVAMFLVSAFLLPARTTPRLSPFHRWYALGMFLIAAGLFGVLVQAVHSSVLGWTGVGTQWLGSVYLLGAAFAAVRQSGRSSLSMAGQPPDTRLRYAVALVFTFAGGALARLFVRNLDPHIVYLALYPVVIVAALYGGRGPGLVSTALLVVGVDIFWPGPVNSAGGSDAAEWIARILFFAGSTGMVFVVDAMQAARAGRVRAELDVTAQKRVEEALKASHQAKDEFLAMLGHELRNPLGAIASATSLLNAAGGAEPTSARARAVIMRQVQLLSRLVDDLLDVSRVTSGKVTLVRQPIDLAELVRNAVGGWRFSGRLDRHQVSVDVVPVWADADTARVEQVVSNLVGNALKYTPPGGAVAIRVYADADAAVLQVQDTGAGIPPNVVDRMFDLFVQGERTIDRAQGGLGVGLTLVRALVEMHGGTVRGTSDGPDRGSTFTVRLPRTTAPPQTSERSPAPPGHRSPRTILVIEDNADAREMMRTQLMLEGHDLHEAADGDTGVSLATSLVPDVALIDVGLPVVDGYEVARRIRATPAGKSILLIAVTGYGQAEDRRRALDAGFDAHLTKPVLPERLAEALAGSRRPTAG
jgi:signal transduction histidine kinase